MISLMFGLLTIKLHSPEFNDSQTTVINTGVMTSMTGAPRAKRGHQVTRLRYSLNRESRVKIQEFKAFLAAALGHQIRLIDHNLVQWRGHLIAEPEIVTSTRGIGRSGTREEDSGFTLEFEGVKV